MTAASIAILLILAVIETLASYISRVYAEFGKILSREVQENLDAWEEQIEPHLGLSRDHAAVSALVAQQLALCGIALVFGAILFGGGAAARPGAGEIAQAVLGVILAVVLCSQVIPWLLFERTRGKWSVRLLWPILFILWAVTPITVLIRFFFSVVSLAEEPVTAQEEAAVDVEALLEAGEEEGILEKTDRDLVRSAVEFGDKLVKEVMTPRPRIFAVRDTTTLEQFLVQLREQNYSRVPVFSSSLDNVTGIAFSHDLLQIADDEARTRTVSSIQKPAAFVPETKRGYELLREMQREKQHMRIVIDEYGGVSGLVTIEDLLEQIVGDIRDEHENDAPVENAQREESGSWLVPGGFPVDELARLLEEPVEPGNHYEATTVGGLVSEIEGRIPLAGEVVMLESAGIRMEVVASTDRRVERVRIFPNATEEKKNAAVDNSAQA
ncbi:MAG TPA: hemolysin family protein [Terracidiphilus sp.]|nr:hemolysin family protein [Terracidiphilus sp.]